MGFVFSGDLSDEACSDIGLSSGELAKSEAEIQDSLEGEALGIRPPREHSAHKVLLWSAHGEKHPPCGLELLKARFNPSGETPYRSRLVTRFQR